MDVIAWDRRYSAAELIWSAEANRFVIAETEALPPGRAFDMACGEGRNAIWLANRGWDVTGADFSGVALGKAAKLAATLLQDGASPIRWVQADVTVHGPSEAGYDLVVVAYLQLPCEQRRAALTRAAAGLAPGGHLLVVAHDASNLTDGVGGPQEAAVLYTPRDVLSDLEGAGLSTVRAERVARAVTVDGEQRTAWDALVHLASSGAAPQV